MLTSPPPSLLARQLHRKPIVPSLLFPTKAACTFIPLTPLAALSDSPDLLCIEEAAAFRCLRSIYPRLTGDDYRWWRYYHGFEAVYTHGDASADRDSVSVISHLGFTKAEWAQYDAALATQPGSTLVAATVHQRRPVGRPPKGSGFFAIPHPRRAGKHVHSFYEAPALIFRLVGSYNELHESHAVCMWHGNERILTTVDTVYELLQPVLTEVHKKNTGGDALPANRPVTRADALMWLFFHGFSKHLMVTEVATEAKRTVYSAPAFLLKKLEVDYQARFGDNGPLAFLASPASATPAETHSDTFGGKTERVAPPLGTPKTPKYLDPDGILMECD